LFIHFDLPRAAGDSLMDCVGRLYGHDKILRIGWGIRYDLDIGRLMEMPQAERDALKRRYSCFITKHTFPLQRLLGLPYVGFMRNPIDWYVSSYFYARQTSLGDPSEPYGFAIEKYNLSLFDFVRWLMDIGHDNIQLKNVLALQADVTDGLPPRPACIAVGRAQLDAAADFTARSFAFFAPTEKFAEAVYALGVLFDWPHLPLWQRRGSSGWRRDYVAPPGLEDFLRERNAFDCELFSRISEAFDIKFAGLYSAAGDDIADYDACSRDPDCVDSTPFHFANLPTELITALRCDYRPSADDSRPLRLGPLPASVKGDFVHGAVHGHLIWSRHADAPPYVALPLEATYGMDQGQLPQSLLFTAGTLRGRDPVELRRRLLAGDVPSLVETFGDGMIWFFRGTYYLADGNIDAAAIYGDPTGELAKAVAIGDTATAHDVLQLLADPFMMQRLADYELKEPEEGAAQWRAMPLTPGLPQYQAASRAALVVTMMRAGALRFTTAPPLNLGSLGTYNLAQYNGRYYGILQGQGDLLDLLVLPERGENLLEANHLDELSRLVMAKIKRDIDPLPRFIEAVGNYNLVQVADVNVAVPQQLGNIDLGDRASLRHPGVIVSRSLQMLRRRLQNQENAAAAQQT